MPAKTKPPAPAVTPDFLAKLKGLQERYDVAKRDYDRGKEKLKILKEVMDDYAEALFDFIRGTDGSAPLFEREEEDGDE
jgi:hypothetical protein